MKRFAAILLASTTLLAAGCRSAYVEATVHNGSGGPVRLVEVDYPSASFGKESLPADGEFHYRFKVLGSGATKVTWTGADRKEHTVTGPTLHEGNQGRLTIELGPQTAVWTPQLQGR